MLETTLETMQRVAVIAMSLAGCSTTYVSVDRLLGDVRRDEAAVVTKMRDQVVGLQGEVRGKGRTTPGTTARDLGLENIEIELGEKHAGYLTLQSTRANPGQVLCLFGPSAVDGLAEVREGDMVTVTCAFRKVAGTQPERVPVFDECYLE